MKLQSQLRFVPDRCLEFSTYDEYLLWFIASAVDTHMRPRRYTTARQVKRLYGCLCRKDQGKRCAIQLSVVMFINDEAYFQREGGTYRWKLPLCESAEFKKKVSRVSVKWSGTGHHLDCPMVHAQNRRSGSALGRLVVHLLTQEGQTPEQVRFSLRGPEHDSLTAPLEGPIATSCPVLTPPLLKYYVAEARVKAGKGVSREWTELCTYVSSHVFDAVHGSKPWHILSFKAPKCPPLWLGPVNADGALSAVPSRRHGLPTSSKPAIAGGSLQQKVIQAFGIASSAKAPYVEANVRALAHGDLQNIQDLRHDPLQQSSDGEAFLFIQLPHQLQALQKLGNGREAVLFADATFLPCLQRIGLTLVIVHVRVPIADARAMPRFTSVPIAFAFMPEEAKFYCALFRTLRRVYKQACGTEWELPGTLLTDMNPAALKGLHSAFPDRKYDTTWLWCRYHVLKAVERKTKDTHWLSMQKIDEVVEGFRRILHARNAEAFTKERETFEVRLKELSTVAGTVKPGLLKYFSRYWETKEHWQCFIQVPVASRSAQHVNATLAQPESDSHTFLLKRRHLLLSTNSPCESTHSILKGCLGVGPMKYLTLATFLNVALPRLGDKLLARTQCTTTTAYTGYFPRRKWGKRKRTSEE